MMQRFTDITKALSDEQRVRALLMLRGGELCLCQIIDVLKLSPSTISKHLSILRAAGLVEVRKEGRWHYYRLAEKPEPMARRAITWTLAMLCCDETVVRDDKAVGRAIKADKSDLCACYDRS